MAASDRMTQTQHEIPSNVLRVLARTYPGVPFTLTTFKHSADEWVAEISGREPERPGVPHEQRKTYACACIAYSEADALRNLIEQARCWE